MVIDLYTIQPVNFTGTNFCKLIKRCLSTNFRELKFRGHTCRHEFLFSAQQTCQTEAAEKQNVRMYYQWRLSKRKAAITHSAVWVAKVGEQLQCAQVRRNAKDPFAVGVLNGSDHSQEDFMIVLVIDINLQLCFTVTDF